jgi:hypothetical protein
MAYREVTMVEIREVLRQFLAGTPLKRIASRVGLDIKTVRRYARVGQAQGLVAGAGEVGLTEAILAGVVQALQAAPERPLGEAWQRCEGERERIASWVGAGVRLSKARRLLQREGIDVPTRVFPPAARPSLRSARDVTGKTLFRSTRGSFAWGARRSPST